MEVVIIMNQQYIDECTQEWELLHEEGKLELWKYKDLVDWATSHCIKVEGKVKAVIDSDMKVNPYTAFDLAKQLLSKDE